MNEVVWIVFKIGVLCLLYYVQKEVGRIVQESESVWSKR